MRLVAHRGASLERQENTLEALLLGAEIGADMVECDPRLTKDGKIILFHDNDLGRLTGDERKINELTLDEIRAVLQSKGLKVTTFDEVIASYDKKTPILLDFTTAKAKEDDIRLVCNDAFFKWLSEQNIPVVCGVHFVEEAKSAAKYFPKEQILAFLPNESLCEEFFEAGAGIIRLWENWLERVSPDEIRQRCPGARVFIMAKRPGSGSDGTPESLDYLTEIKADGVLLNNIRMAVDHFAKGGKA